MPFRLDSTRNPSGIRYIDVTDSALNAVQSSAGKAVQAETSGGTSHLHRQGPNRPTTRNDGSWTWK